MKNLLFFCLPVLFFFGFLPDAAGQTNILFDYDDAGNRVLRYVEAPPASLAAVASDTVAVVSDIPTAPDTILATFRVSMYPNPVQTNLLVHIEILDASPALPSTFNVRIVSMQGAVVYNQTHAGTTPIQVNMYNSQVGYYQLTVTRGNEIHQLTIVKI